MGQFVKVANVAEMQSSDSGKLVEVAGQPIALFNVGGKFYAIDSTCTHVGGPLADGFLEENIVTCPWHGGRFDVTTGEVKGPPPQKNVKSYPVRVVGDDIEVEV